MKQWPDAPREGGDSTWRVVLLGALAIVAILVWGGERDFNIDLPNIDVQRHVAEFERQMESVFASNSEPSNEQTPATPQQVSVSEDWENPIMSGADPSLPTHLESVPFDQCVKLIQQTAGTIGRDITVIEDGSDRRVVALHTADGDLVLTCSNGGMTMEQRPATQP